MSYSSFDLIDKSTGADGNGTRYFPLRRAENATQYTLGRAFFQDAYVIADYERSTFSISQAVFPDITTKENLVPILPYNVTHNHPTDDNRHGKSKNAVIAGAVAGAVIFVILCITVVMFVRRKRSQQAQQALKSSTSNADGSSNEYFKPELDTGVTHEKYEVAADDDDTKVSDQPPLPSQLGGAEKYELASPIDSSSGADAMGSCGVSDVNIWIAAELPAAETAQEVHARNKHDLNIHSLVEQRSERGRVGGQGVASGCEESEQTHGRFEQGRDQETKDTRQRSNVANTFSPISPISEMEGTPLSSSSMTDWSGSNRTFSCNWRDVF